ncbi:HlyC/CorC family transporter [Chitinolyticbacter meiyuanensis]|uniref:HlyC/CorC family transporter n=1 Tax=Chitinolyticbacter meiyuanensis TaxID=682798 RepID=UPI0011E5B1B0|nr:transporter associated domain-containing protein [Chitinolyticbacter meiyuanensis]
MDDSPSQKNWLERLTHFLLREPENRGELVDILHSAFERHLLDADALAMIEGVLNVGDLQVRDVMVSRSRMDVIDLTTPHAHLIAHAIDTAHSRFPVVDGSLDEVIGILLAKDLLRYASGRQMLDLRTMLRPAVFVPETQRLNVLLKAFRDQRNHMAIVVDEHGSVAGLVTIEDVIEQIVGDIADEHDVTEQLIVPAGATRWRVQGATELDALNLALGSELPRGDYRTVAGLVIDHCGHVPLRGESVVIDGWRLRVIRADRQRVHALLVERLPQPVVPEEA